MSASENFGQDDLFFPPEFSAFFDTYLAPDASEQVDDPTQFTASRAAYPAGQIELGDVGFLNDYPGNLSMAQEPMGEANILPQPDNFQEVVAETLGFDETLDVPMTEVPNTAQCDNYGHGQNFAMPTAYPSTTPVFSQYPPLPAVGDGVYEPQPSQEDAFYPTVGPEMLLDTSVSVPPLPPVEADGNMAFQGMFPHGVPPPVYPPYTPVAPPSFPGTIAPMQASSLLAETPCIPALEDSYQALARTAGSASTDAVPNLPESSTSSSSSRKRQAPAWSNDIFLPPIKRGGRHGPMHHEARSERAAMRKKGVCIMCRQEKRKCDGGIPCELCQKKLDSGITKNPCTKAQFLDIVECKPCYLSSTLYESTILEKYDNITVLEHLVTARRLLDLDSTATLEIKADMLDEVTVSSSWSLIVLPFLLHPELVEAAEHSPDALPQLPPIVAKLPSVLAKECPEDKAGFTFSLPRHGLPPHYITVLQQHFCAARCYEFTLVHDDGRQREAVLNESIRGCSSLLLWFAARQFEIRLFRYLQNSVNQISNMSSADLGTTILILLCCVDALSPRLNNYTEYLYPEQELTLDGEVIRQLEDRQKRLRVALFVYANIACSKLLPFSDFSTELGKLTFRFTQEEFKSLMADLDSFDLGVRKKADDIRANFDCLMNHMEVWEELHPNTLHDPTSGLTGAQNAMQDIFDDLQSGVTNGPIQEYDTRCMDGLLSATVSESFDEIRAWKFFSVAKIHWVQAFSNLAWCERCSDYDDLRLFLLAKTLRYRSRTVDVCELVKQAIPRSYLSPANCLEMLLERVIPGIANETETRPEYSKKEQKKFLLTLREGLRWRELMELAGEEICLLDSHSPYFNRDNGIWSLDVPFIVSNGSEAEFYRLKRLLTTSQSWLVESCRQLTGVVGWFKEAWEVVRNDKDAALKLASQIQERVYSVFGSREFLDEVIGRRLRTASGGLVSRDPTNDGQDEKEPAEEELEELTRSTRVLLETFMET